MKKKIIDYLVNYIVITIGMFVSLLVLFGIGSGFIKLFAYSPVLFGIVLIVLVTSGVVTYIVTNDKGGK